MQAAGGQHHSLFLARLTALWEVMLSQVILSVWQLLALDFVLALFGDIQIQFYGVLVPVIWLAQSCITAYGNTNRKESIRINGKILLFWGVLTAGKLFFEANDFF